MVDTTGNQRNGCLASRPNIFTDFTDTYQYGLLIRLDWGVTLWRRAVGSDPRDPASYSTQDLSANATAVAGLRLPINPVDNHWNLGMGVDKFNRIHISGNQHAHDAYGGRNGQNYIVSNGAWPPVWTRPTWSTLPWASVGANSHTYNTFALTSDGRLIWLLDQQDVVNYSIGRDYLAYYMPATGSPTATGWLPLRTTGSTPYGEIAITDPTSTVGDAERVYVQQLICQPRKGLSDRIWIGGNWRTQDITAESATDPFIMYTDDGATWKNVFGTTISMPRTWTNRAEATIESAPDWGAILSLTIDSLGQPHVIVENGSALGGVLTSITNSRGLPESITTVIGGTPVADGVVHCWFNGSAWVIDRIRAIGGTSNPQFFCFSDDNDGYYMSGINDTGTVIVAAPDSYKIGHTRMSNGWSSSYVDVPKFSWKDGKPQKLSYFNNSLTGGSAADPATASETWTPSYDPTAMMRGRFEVQSPDEDTPFVTIFGKARDHGYPGP